MAALFPPVISYKMDFKPEDMKTVQLEVTVAGRKLKSQVPKFTGDGVESLLYTKQQFSDAMATQGIDAAEWQEEFGRTLHGDPSDIYNEVLDAGDDLDQPFDDDEAGFELAFEFYIKRYVADPSGRDTLAHALDTRAFRFGLSEEVGPLRVEKHVRRIKTCVRYLPWLPGTIVFGPTQLRHTVMGTFPKKWQESYMMGGAERYHQATIADIQQHMAFVYALEEKSKPAQKSDKNKKIEKERRRRGGHFYRSGRGRGDRGNNNTQPYNNNYENHYQDGGRGGGGRYNNRGGRGGGG